MIPRGLWFVAGAGAGVYAMSRARRLAESLTADGLRDRWNGLSVGWQMFADEVSSHSRARESELREQYGLAPLPSLAPQELPNRASEQSRKREIS